MSAFSASSRISRRSWSRALAKTSDSIRGPCVGKLFAHAGSVPLVRRRSAGAVRRLARDEHGTGCRRRGGRGAARRGRSRRPASRPSGRSPSAARRRSSSAWRGEVRAIAVVAAGGLAAGAATVAAVSAAKAMTGGRSRRAGPPGPGRSRRDREPLLPRRRSPARPLMPRSDRADPRPGRLAGRRGAPACALPLSARPPLPRRGRPLPRRRLRALPPRPRQRPVLTRAWEGSRGEVAIAALPAPDPWLAGADRERGRRDRARGRDRADPPRARASTTTCARSCGASARIRCCGR